MRTFWTFFTGLAAGAVIALLYAPDRGSETRRKVAGQARKMKENLTGSVEEGIDELSETGERMYGKAQSMADKASGRGTSRGSSY